MELVFRPEALKEVLDAQRWYEDRAAGLGLEFARADDVAIERIWRTPTAYASLDSQHRHLMLRKFPYSIVYHATGTEVVVVSCFHHRRKPASWVRNLRN